MSSSKYLNADDAVDYERWELPAVGDENSKRRQEQVTAAEIESIQQQAYEEGLASGYQDGYAKGLAQGETEIQTKAAHLHTLLQALESPFETLDEEVIEQTAQLALAVARQLIRRELHTEPGQVVAVVREALDALPVSARHIRVYLHPEDAELVREVLSLHEDNGNEARTWRIVEEPLLTRGGCKVSAENSNIDATVEKRLHRLITTIMGGERSHD